MTVTRCLISWQFPNQSSSMVDLGTGTIKAYMEKSGAAEGKEK
jgi:hypothetical protein